MGLERGVQRWAVDISQWNPSPAHFSFCMSFLPQREHSSITRFVKTDDQKRALVSRLLQYSLIHKVLGIPFNEISIKRTIEGKPYLDFDGRDLGYPNFNFNASHHGDYVAIASEPVCLIGLDIMSTLISSNEEVQDFIKSFSSCFSSFEWCNIFNIASSSEMLIEFYRYWCLKEAFVKAIGSGIGYNLDKIEFHHNGWKDIYVKVNGKELKSWRFWLVELGKDHLVSIARGHPSHATGSYIKTLGCIEMEDNQYNQGLHLPNSSFLFLGVEDLLPISPGTS